MEAMTRDAALAAMQALHDLAANEERVFSEEEAAQFAELRLMATAKKDDQVEQTIERPVGALRRVLGATRSLSEAAMTDGLVARVFQNGTARMEVPVFAKALGSDQAASPAPGVHVPPKFLAPFSSYYGLYGRLIDALSSVPIEGTNAITYSRLNWTTAGGGGNKAAKVQELAAKPESILATVEVTQTLDTYAHWISASKQVLSDLVGLRSLLDSILVEGLLDKTDAAVYATMTTGGNFTAYTATAGDVLGDAIARVATALAIAGGKSVKVAMNPQTLLTMSLTKASGTGEYLGLPPSINATLVPAASVAAGKILAWSDTGALWANREGVTVQAGLNNDDFTKNKVTILAEHRGAVLTFNPAHVLFGDALAA